MNERARRRSRITPLVAGLRPVVLARRVLHGYRFDVLVDLLDMPAADRSVLIEILTPPPRRVRSVPPSGLTPREELHLPRREPLPPEGEGP